MNTEQVQFITDTWTMGEDYVRKFLSSDATGEELRDALILYLEGGGEYRFK